MMTEACRLTYSAVLCTAAAFPSFPSSSAAQDAPTLPSYEINGSISTRYVSRSTDDPGVQFSDKDLFADLRLDVARPVPGTPEFHVLGALRSDLDGGQNATGFFPFEDIGDTHERRYLGTLYEAYVLLADPSRPDSRVRIGRQSGTRDEQIFFDGIAADLDLGGEMLNLTLYGGAAIHFYEGGSHYGEDTLEGAGVDFRPLPGTGVSVDFLALKDAREFSPDDGTVQDRLFSIKAWQRFPPLGSISAQYRYLDGEPRDLTVKALAASAEAGGEAMVSYVRQFRTQFVQTNELSPFVDLLGQSAPYQSYDLRLRKFIADLVAVDLGYYKRALLDAPADQGPFDREYSRQYCGVEVTDLGIRGLSSTLTLEIWESLDRKFRTAGFDLSYVVRKMGRREAKISVGSVYSLYRYDYYITPEAREQVRVYYLTAQHPLGAGFSANAGLEHEHGIENYDTLRLGMRYDF